MMHIRIDIFGWRRVRELYEEGARKDAKIKELRTATQAQDRQMRGWGKDFEQLLKEKDELKCKLEVLAEERDKWVERYLKSEEARKHLGEKLQAATELLKAAEERERERYARGTPSVNAAGRGDTSPDGGGRRAVEGAGPYERNEGRRATARVAPTAAPTEEAEGGGEA